LNRIILSNGSKNNNDIAFLVECNKSRINARFS